MFDEITQKSLGTHFGYLTSTHIIGYATVLVFRCILFGSESELIHRSYNTCAIRIILTHPLGSSCKSYSHSHENIPSKIPRHLIKSSQSHESSRGFQWFSSFFSTGPVNLASFVFFELLGGALAAGLFRLTETGPAGAGSVAKDDKAWIGCWGVQFHAFFFGSQLGLSIVVTWCYITIPDEWLK